MKTTTLLFVLLAACGNETTQVFSLAADTSAQDSELFARAVDEVNANAGCEMFRVDSAAPVNVHFSEDAKCEAALAAQKSSHEEGFTTVNTIAAPTVCIGTAATFAQNDEGRQAAMDVMLHEIGHAAGLFHTANHFDVMYAAAPGFLADGSLARYVAQLHAAGRRCLE